MMRKYISILTSLLILFACSDEKDNELVGEKQELSVNANITVSVVTGTQTRANDIKEDFDLYIEQTAPTSPDFTKPYSKFDARYVADDKPFKITKAGSPWYWDDNGGVEAKLNLIGIHPTGAAISDPATALTFPWSVAADQSKATNSVYVEYVKSDLKISGLKDNYKLSVQKINPELQFSHVLSQLTFVLKKGTGFEAETFDPNIKTIVLKTKADITINSSTGKVSVAPSGSDLGTEIIPKYKGIGTEAGTKIYEAIAIPDQTLTAGADFATISLTLNGGEENEYKVKLPGTSPAQDIKFEQGKNYEFEITINKTNTIATTTITSWGDGKKVVETIDIGATAYAGSNSIDIEVGAQLYMMIKKGTTEVDNMRRVLTYEKPAVDGKWGGTGVDPIYMDDIPKSTTTYAYGLLFNHKDAVTIAKTEMKKYPDNIYMGRSQQLSQAYNNLYFKGVTVPFDTDPGMIHPFSRLEIKIRTEDDSKKGVILENLKKIQFNGVVSRFKDINPDEQDIDYYTNVSPDYYSSVVLSIATADIKPEKDGTPAVVYNYYQVPHIYIKPDVTIPANTELLRIFYNDGSGIVNEYPFVFNDGIKFEPNKKYAIQITLDKTEIAERTVTITDWVQGESIDGGGTIKE